MKQNIPLHKSLKFKINLLVATLFLVILLLLIYQSNQNQKEMIRTKEEDLDQIAVETIDRRFTVSYQILETSTAQITASPLIIETIASGDAEKLSKLVEVSYEKLKAAGVDELHFHLPDDTSLLNLYKPKNNEEITSCDRTLPGDMNSDPKHLPIKGIEECRHGLYLRYIEPVYNNNEYIGSVELGMEIGSRILNIFKNVSGGEWYLYSLHDKEQSLLKGTTSGDKYPLEITEELATSIDNGDVIKIENSPNIIQIVPLSNHKGEYTNYIKRVFDNSELLALQNHYAKKWLQYGVTAAFLGMILLWIVLTYLLSPLIYLERKARKLESGILTEPIEIQTNDEIGYLAGAMENMRQSLLKRELELKEQSYIDPLTKVLNRLSFEQYLDEIVQNEWFPTALIMADIDGLKRINDSKGHAAGDAHIIKSTIVIKNGLRDNDKLFRIGGDEFIIVSPNTDLETAELVLARINKELNVYNDALQKNETVLSISFGIGVCYGAPCTLEKAMAIADQEMYKNKAEKNIK